MKGSALLVYSSRKIWTLCASEGRRFLHEQLDFLVVSLRARAAVLGSATQALHRL